LYNWYAVNDPRGIAPNGYHVANNDEWNTLLNYLGGRLVAGGALKETGTSHWLSPNTGATNSSGFTGLGGGWRNTLGGFDNLKIISYFWSEIEYSPEYAYIHELIFNSINSGASLHDKKNGFSVRLIKD
jgi:uncharacterized protein (TIGR02145 family)